jgi:hypothetical protein
LPPLFVYGTLIDPATRAAVFAAPLRVVAGTPARLAGFRRVVGRGRRYPVLIRSRVAVTDGLLIPRVGGRAWRRLIAYEGAEYRLARVRVRRTDSVRCWRGCSCRAASGQRSEAGGRAERETA